ncbi:MAG: DUF4315 family protein [Angelakisella sp.]
MNAKYKKVMSDMKKLEDKMELLQSKWEELNKQKTEFENLEIIGLIRGAKISTENLNDVIMAYRSKNGVPFSSEKQEENKNEEN